MVTAADYPFLNILWTMLVLFGLVIWFWLLIRIFADIFRRRDISGLMKAGWCVLVIVVPLFGVLVYLIAHGDEMGRRDMEEAEASRAQFDDYVRNVATSEGPTAEIEKARHLLDEGAITQAEYETIKAKVVVG
jgi:Phospholipase_D-nuclease N-terminal/Short C-terminal domain